VMVNPRKIFDEIVNIFPNPTSISIVSWVRMSGTNLMGERGEGKEISRGKRSILETLSRAYSPVNLREVFNRASNLLDMQKSALQSCGYHAFDFSATTKSRLIVGMASQVFGKQIFEVGLSWDPLLNLPYIPGSSLKGAFRSYLETEKPDFVNLLGSRDEASSIIFLNSYPVNSRGSLIVPEVTTPIYMEQEMRIRETEAEPRPVLYPVINRNVTFRIVVGVKNKKMLEDQLRHFLGEVLKRGIGAKTLVGYGFMERIQ